MLVRYGGGIVDARGSVAGHTLSRNGAGPHMKARIAGVQPQTGKQGTAQNVINHLNKLWQNNLSDADRLAWSAFSATLPQTNRLGNVVILSGHQMFLKINSYRTHLSLSILTTPPVTTSVDSILTLSVAAVFSSGPTLTVTETDTNLLSSQQLIIFASPPVSPGKAFISSQLRRISNVACNSTNSILTHWQQAFGTTPSTGGQKIFIRAFVYSGPNGIMSPSVQASAIST